jgi:hypothetical protein
MLTLAENMFGSISFSLELLLILQLSLPCVSYFGGLSEKLNSAHVSLSHGSMFGWTTP